MKFGIISAPENSTARDLAKKIKEYLVLKGHKVIDDGKFKGVDLVLVLGGDGTLIHSACEYVELSIPFVGVNAGTLGFLTAAEASDWQKAVDKLIEGNYVVSERMTLEASKVESGKWKVESFRALNEMVIKGMYRVVNLEIKVGEEEFLNITGDGVIIATQTGSTAYSLSAGGPIVDPEIDCLVVTPVNAVGLPVPSIALSANDVLEVKLVHGTDVSLIIDGGEHTKIVEGQTIRVSRGKHRIKFIYFDKHHFLKALNAKFGLASRLVG